MQTIYSRSEVACHKINCAPVIWLNSENVGEGRKADACRRIRDETSGGSVMQGSVTPFSRQHSGGGSSLIN